MNCAIFSSEFQASCVPFSDSLQAVLSAGVTGRFGTRVVNPAELAGELTPQLRRLFRRSACQASGCCCVCENLGATLGCCRGTCPNSYHLACAHEAGASVLYAPRRDHDEKGIFPPLVVALCKPHIDKMVEELQIQQHYPGDVMRELTPAPGTLAVNASNLHYVIMNSLVYCGLNVPFCKLPADEDNGTAAVLFAYGNIEHIPNLPWLPQGDIRPLNDQLREEWLSVEGNTENDFIDSGNVQENADSGPDYGSDYIGIEGRWQQHAYSDSDSSSEYNPPQ